MENSAGKRGGNQSNRFKFFKFGLLSFNNSKFVYFLKNLATSIPSIIISSYLIKVNF